MKAYQVLAMLLAFVSSSALAAHYQITVSPANPMQLHATLTDFPATLQDRVLRLHGVSRGLASQLVAPHCDKQTLVLSGPGEWVLPAGCGQVSWDIHAQSVLSGEVDSSEQKSVYFQNKKWWLLSEPTSLLRLDGDAEDSLTILGMDTQQQVGAMARSYGQWLVPSAGAPEFYAFGNLALIRQQIGPFSVDYVADDAAEVARLQLPALHADALSYLAKILPPAKNTVAKDRHLLVVWLGIDEKQGRSGGAAGKRSFLANYIKGAEKNTAASTALTLMILAHEQFHQLAAMSVEHEVKSPTWAGEGLAHYYGLKTLAQSKLPADEIAKLRAHFIQPEQVPKNGLLALERKYKQGDRSVYPLFYAQGATFWSEVDRLLQSASQNKRSLDDFLPLLLADDFAQAGQLPPRFLYAIRPLSGPDLDTLLAKYLGQ
ncbi:hypothetical protein [Janthinobacterium sp. B9-8]|uniref:hypothetical protein n=1 Tax=Janthinobacterium sp. B9-8 TaxID=1236179 RepID=UPI00061D21E9|nr:hypothetical protein [Janthinobacterium sp. B9-8]AMC33198.1 hypothetical protein VN23_00435 [Janthinobacterium sp. B9-8]